MSDAKITGLTRQPRLWTWCAGLAVALAAMATYTVFAPGVPAAMKPQAVAGNSERGRHLMATYQCGHCHDVPDVASAQGALGPSLHAFAHRSYIAGEIPNQPETLARWIVDPASVVPGTTMPAMGVNARDAQDIVAFLSTLR